MSLYAHKPNQPFHLSAGVLLVNEQGEILAHKVTRSTVPAEYAYKLAGNDTVYILMRETPEAGELLEDTAVRGLAEEFGATGTLSRYLGSLQAFIPEEGGYEKTTIYFEAKLVSLQERPSSDAEGYSELAWCTPEFLIERMREQGRQEIRGDIDESKIIEAYLSLKNL